jgi:hypothetical protein
VGFKPEIFCSVGGRDDHYATPPGAVLDEQGDQIGRIFTHGVIAYFG